MKAFTYDYSSPDHVIFTCWNEDHSGCGCHSTSGDLVKIRENIVSLENSGYKNMNDYRWNFSTKSWEN